MKGMGGRSSVEDDEEACSGAPTVFVVTLLGFIFIAPVWTACVCDLRARVRESALARVRVCVRDLGAHRRT